MKHKNLKLVLKGIIDKYIQNVEDQEDIYQLVCYNITIAYPKYVDKGCLVPWMCKIATNTCIDSLRRLKRQRNVLQGYAYANSTVNSDENTIQLVCREVLDKFVEYIHSKPISTVQDRIIYDFYSLHYNKSRIARELHISRKLVYRTLAEYNQKLNQVADHFSEGSSLNDLKNIKFDF